MKSFTSPALQLCLAAVVACQNSSTQVINAQTYALDGNQTLSKVSASIQPYFQQFSPKFAAILGSSPNITEIVSSPYPLYHEAGVHYSSNPTSFFATSNQYNKTANGTKLSTITKVTQTENGNWASEEVIPYPAIPYANGATKYTHRGVDGILIDAQGNLTTNGGLTFMAGTAPYLSIKLLDNYLGIPFDSPNDVHVLKNGAIYFTDNPVGFGQGIRPNLTLPGAVWRFVPGSTNLRMITEDFVNPNGITFSPDEKTAYVTSTQGGMTSSPIQPRSIYAYDVINEPSANKTAITNSTIPIPPLQPYFANKRLFAFSARGIPDGIKTDTAGNVYAGDGDGVSVYDSTGLLIGRILVEGGAANFVLGKGEIFLFAEKKVWRAQLDKSVIGSEAH